MKKDSDSLVDEEDEKRAKAHPAVAAMRKKANLLNKIINGLSELPASDASEIAQKLYETFYIDELH